MRKFIDDDFLLDHESSRILYHEFAKEMPIYDYHCHLSPNEIAENKQFQNLTEIWLNGDHYKWRAMRANGISERLITGNADDKEKFDAWAKTMPSCIGNPLYHWTHLELKRYFNIDLALSEKTGDEIWEHCNTLLKQENYSAQAIIKKSNVKVICTTDDPVDTLEFHKEIKENENIEAAVLPAFRPDKGLEISHNEFLPFVNGLSSSASLEINKYPDFLKALEDRVKYFHNAGCRVSDHGFESLFYEESTLEEASAIFDKAVNGQTISLLEEKKYKTYTLLFLGKLYHAHGWVMQLHIGAIRNNNTKMFKRLGPDTGFDSMNDFELAKPLNQLLNQLDLENELPKTILYNLNPVHNPIIASAIGNFQNEEARGKLQFGTGWWFNDQKDGMLRQMTDLSNIGLISNFLGMVTDSRSFLSYTRHEYFRRILCNMLGGWMHKGEAPDDYELMGTMVQDICYNNAKNYFEITR
ncbi:glucuronate isomerase [Fictibacillus sp. WQ 8-8]|uniref:glucuronate isomerase n=1 Tax=Fictibacillus sp. WQ 8-8 TaxID=2938788 RepID=UPI00210A09BC|nr:glucuronate isomerase [Fictibacillus sp. WQ 8-8]MCQ6264073.1 glucuronate isomerase [Fictibacillus sp. WQ 8-8]